MAKDPVGTSGLSTLPSTGGGEGSRQKPLKATPQNRIFDFPQEYALGHENPVTRDERRIETYAILDHGTLYMRAETSGGTDMNDVQTENIQPKNNAPWMYLHETGDAIINKAEEVVNVVEKVVPSFAKDSVDAAGELLSIATGFGQETPKPRNPEQEAKQAELAKKQQEQIVIVERQVTTEQSIGIFREQNEQKEEIRLKTAGETTEQLAEESGVQKGYKKLRDAASRAWIGLKRMWQATKQKAQASTPFQMVGDRMSKIRSLFNNNKQGENQMMNQGVG